MTADRRAADILGALYSCELWTKTIDHQLYHEIGILKIMRSSIPVRRPNTTPISPFVLRSDSTRIPQAAAVPKQLKEGRHTRKAPDIAFESEADVSHLLPDWTTKSS
jgi:hypothetical protein